MLRQYAGEAQTAAGIQVEKVRAQAKGTGGDVGSRLVGDDGRLASSPQTLDRVQFRAGRGQPTQLDAEIRSQATARLGPMGRSSVDEEHDVPATPSRSQLPQMRLEGLLVPRHGPGQGQTAGADAHGSEEHHAAAVAGDRDFGLLADARPRTPQRWRLGDDRRVGEQDDRAPAPLQPSLEPPCACRHVGDRRLSTKRGLFQRYPSVWIARRTVVSLTLRSCSTRRCRRSSPAVQFRC